MKKALLAILAIITLLTVAGCAGAASAAELKSNKHHDTSPVVSPADATALANGNAAFALDLYQQLIKAGGNVFYSPYSISEVLAMTYGGARGDTAAQMAAALHYQLPQDRLHPAFNSVDIALASRSNGKEGKDGGRLPSECRRCHLGTKRLQVRPILSRFTCSELRGRIANPRFHQSAGGLSADYQ